MERRVTVTVDAAGGIAPATPQYAGVQGEHNTCRVVFDISAWSEEPFLYRGEFVSGDGTGGTTDLLEVSEGCVSFPLPAAWTAAGGRAVARLVASVTVNGAETQTVYAVDVPLYFAAKQECSAAATAEEYAGLTALVASVREAVDEVERRLEDGSLIGPPGKQGERGVSGVYVGSGEMPEGYNVQVDPDGEAVVLFPELSIGTVETLPEGSDATATITGTAEHPTLNLGLPMGAQGEPGQDLTDKPWVLVDDITLEKDVKEIEVNLPANTYKEVWVDGVFTIATEETTAKSTQFIIGRVGCTINRRDVSVSNGTKLYYRAHGFLSPKGTMVYDVSIANYKYTGGALSRNAGDMVNTPFTHFNMVRFWLASNTHLLATGSTFTVWGR